MGMAKVRVKQVVGFSVMYKKHRLYDVSDEVFKSVVGFQTLTVHDNKHCRV